MMIKSVLMYTDRLLEMKEFYVQDLGFSLLDESNSSFTIEVGKSHIKFSSTTGENRPFYHFAFDIPANKFNEAKAWAKERVTLTIENGKDEAFFEHFPAHAFYFDDPAGNIVEFISRPSITKSNSEPFTINSVLYISEMSLVIENPKSAYDMLTAVGVPERDHRPVNEAGLTFMGERESGVFLLLVPPGRKWLFSQRYSEVHPLEILLDNDYKVVINDDKELSITYNE